MNIAKIVIHCSDSPDNLDIGVQEIRRWHVQDRGWSDIGYHYVVRRSGTVEVGRYENGDSVLEGKEIGAHVKGHNSDSLAICWVGRDNMTAAQRHAILKLTKNLIRRLGLSARHVKGHYEIDGRKTCPNIDMDKFRQALEASSLH